LILAVWRIGGLNSELIPNYMYIDVSRLGRTKSGLNSATELHHTPWMVSCDVMAVCYQM